MTIASCDQQLTTSRAPYQPMRIIAPSDTSGSDSVNVSPCSTYDGGHCNFMTVSHEEYNWMQEGADMTTCPDMQHLLQQFIFHGWIHKIDMAPWTLDLPKIPNGDDHYVPGSSPLNGSARIHLDYANAFTGASTTAAVMRHEAAHLLHPEYDEGATESYAQSCSP